MKICKKKVTLIADVFLNLRTRKYIVTEMSEKSRFRGPFDKWHDKRAKTLLKYERQHLYHIYWDLWRILELKKSLWLICKVLGLLVNPLIADDKDSLLNRGNLLQDFQMDLSQERKIFSELSFHFLDLESIFNIFKKKMTLIADVFLSLRTQKSVVR